MKFKNLLKPATPEEALTYAKLPNTVVLGGAMWVRMQKRTFDNAVDLSLLGLDKIEKTDEGLKIGAYVTLRQLETSEEFISYTHGNVCNAFAPIVGVQFRNSATVGGSIFGKFGFSDVTALFSALGAKIVFAEAGEKTVADYVATKLPMKDVLLYILLPKKAPDAAVTLAHRISATDFPLVTVSVVRREDKITIAALPMPVGAGNKVFDINDASADKYMADAPLKENALDSVVYRDKVTRVLVSRAISSVGGKSI